MIFDTHTHLNAEEFNGEVSEVIARANELLVTKFAVVGFDTPTIERALELSQQYEDIYAIVGWHPTEAGSYTKAIEDKLIQQLTQPKVVAMGEMGLDYYWDTATPEDQKRVFRRQIAIAKEMNLPISIHNRDATEDCYQILKEEGIQDIGGIMHSYNGNVEYMKRFLDLGMHISFSGVVTFKNAPTVRECAKAVPKDRFLVETDAPYLAPVPFRGKRNEPGYTRYVVETIAKERGESFETVANQTMQNANKLFRIGQA
ncbi:TatD DNase family protein [Granulicatella balaenopterae]|uniref:TatD DNase family protein n=1 Tax=Granulicatella balaenopterae TaxID=137733 RepID=A0A1H9NHH3_9LACT|nr:TatD family hydrolase [Granulicatella balaenopterae]SER35109.1 TatD DNase family protein [Granulicatella balaenopterae]